MPAYMTQHGILNVSYELTRETLMHLQIFPIMVSQHRCLHLSNATWVVSVNHRTAPSPFRESLLTRPSISSRPSMCLATMLLANSGYQTRYSLASLCCS
jgi:hypothetical protein